MPQSKLGLLVALLAYSVAMKLMPYVLRNCDVQLDPTILYYPWSFSPLTAVCLLSGACLADRRLAFALPLAAMLVGNIGIGLLSGKWEWAFPSGTWWVTYACYAVAIGLGLWLRRVGTRSPLWTAIGMGLGFEVFFFAASNFTYFYGNASLYPQTWSGLVECYVAAWPFFRNAPLSTLAFTALLFGPLSAIVPSEDRQPVEELVPASAK